MTTSPLWRALGVDRDRTDDWRDRALCAQTDPEAFFPEKGGSTREAKAICRACPVAAECLTDALERGERFGIWGGLSERERRRISHQQTVVAIPCKHPDCPQTFRNAGALATHTRHAHPEAQEAS